MDTGACDPCPWRADGECDEPQLCAPGTDAEDCSPIAAESSTTAEASSEGGDTTSAVLDAESGGTSSSSSGAATDDGAPAAATCDDGTVAGPCADCGRAYCCVWIEQATADAESSCIAECMLDAGSVPSCGNLCGSSDPFAEPGITDLFVCLGAACGGVC